MQSINTGTIILMAYPHVFVKPSNEFICKITPYLGIGTKDYIQAGHAALCLIENKTGIIHYHDFGRYITPDGCGRVRSYRTDVELEIPLNAQFKNNTISNIKDILRWLGDHPEKTHGEGDLYASVLYDVDYTKARHFIDTIHNKGSIPYGIFIKSGSNCSRFVADTVIASTTNTTIRKRIKNESLVTPSPIGIVTKGRNSKDIYIVEEDSIITINNISWIDNMKKFLAKKFDDKEKKENTTSIKDSENLFHYLHGIGSGAYFKIEHLHENDYCIQRYNENKEQDFEGIFTPTELGFDIKKDYSFVYDSNCDHCHIKQDQNIYRFNIKKSH